MRSVRGGRPQQTGYIVVLLQVPSPARPFSLRLDEGVEYMLGQGAVVRAGIFSNPPGFSH